MTTLKINKNANLAAIENVTVAAIKSLSRKQAIEAMTSCLQVLNAPCIKELLIQVKMEQLRRDHIEKPIEKLEQLEKETTQLEEKAPKEEQPAQETKEEEKTNDFVYPKKALEQMFHKIKSSLSKDGKYYMTTKCVKEVIKSEAFDEMWILLEDKHDEEISQFEIDMVEYKPSKLGISRKGRTQLKKLDDLVLINKEEKAPKKEQPAKKETKAKQEKKTPKKAPKKTEEKQEVKFKDLPNCPLDDETKQAINDSGYSYKKRCVIFKTAKQVYNYGTVEKAKFDRAVEQLAYKRKEENAKDIATMILQNIVAIATTLRKQNKVSTKKA